MAHECRNLVARMKKMNQESRLYRKTQSLSIFGLMIEFQDIAFFHGISDAIDFCEVIKTERGLGTVSAMLGQCDPVFAGVVLEDPWRFIDSEEVKIDHLAFLYSCGWNRTTAPKNLSINAMKSRKFADIFKANEVNARKPWRIPIARELVKNHYVEWGNAFIDITNCSILSPRSIRWFARYLEFVQHYRLISVSKISRMKMFLNRESRAYALAAKQIQDPSKSRRS